MNTTTPLAAFLSDAQLKEADTWVAKFPAEQKRSATLQVLRIVQDAEGWLKPEAMDAVAEYLGIPKIAVYEVATFYGMYRLAPAGKHTFEICTNLSCRLNDAEALVKHCEKKWGIGLGETTPDGAWSLKAVECLGACVGAPAGQLGRTIHECLTPEKIDALVEAKAHS